MAAPGPTWNAARCPRRHQRRIVAGLTRAIQEQVAKLSVFGVGMKSHTGVAGKMFDVLAKEGVNIDMISTSEIKISVVIDLAKGEPAMRAIHAAFIG